MSHRAPRLRSFSAFVALLGLVALTLFGAPPRASAAPPTAPLSGTAGGSTAVVGVDVATIDVADIDLATSGSTVDSQATPRSASVSQNLGAEAAEALGLTVAANQQVAPPDQGGAETGTLVGVSALGVVEAQAITSRNEAHYPPEGQCLPAGTPLADTTTSTAGVGVTALGGDVVTTGDSTTRGVVSLASTGGDGLNREVRSVATGTVADVALLDGAVTVGVQGDAVLTATADGTAGGAAVDYDAPTVTVTVAGLTRTVALGATVEAEVDGVGTVSVTANEVDETVAANGTSATGSVAVVSLTIELADDLGEVAVDLLPLSASAQAPVGGIDCPAPVVIAEPDDGDVTGPTPTVSGTGEPGASVVVVVDGDEVGTVEVDEDGNWSLSLTDPLAPGDHTVTVTQSVDGVEVGEDSADFVVDATAPAAPVVTDPDEGEVTGPTPTVSGTGEPGASVVVVVDGDEVGTVEVDEDGNWSLPLTDPLAPGDHTVTAVQTDEAGNESDPAEEVAFVVAAPVVITTPADGSSTSDTTPTVSGTGEPGASVVVVVDGDEVGTVEVDEDGNWSLSLTDPLASGDHTVTVTQSVDGVEVGEDSADFVVDATAPAAPVVTDPDEGEVTGPTPTVSGTGEPGASVVVVVDGDEVGTVEVDEDGNWSLPLTDPLAPGDHTVTAVQTDEAGNESDPAEEVAFVVAAPVVITTPADGSSTSDTTPTVSGTGEPGASVVVVVDGDEVGTVEVDEDGNWSLPLTDPLASGDHTVTVTQSVDGVEVGEDSADFAVAADDGGSGDDGTDDGSGVSDGSGADGTSGGSDGLASTGGPGLWAVGLGALLLASGAGALVLGRRRVRG